MYNLSNVKLQLIDVIGNAISKVGRTITEIVLPEQSKIVPKPPRLPVKILGQICCPFFIKFLCHSISIQLKKEENRFVPPLPGKNTCSNQFGKRFLEKSSTWLAVSLKEDAAESNHRDFLTVELVIVGAVQNVFNRNVNF